MDGEHESGRSTNTIREINTALTVMDGNAQLLERKIARGDPISPDFLLSVLALIQRQGWQAARSVADLGPRTENRSPTDPPN